MPVLDPNASLFDDVDVSTILGGEVVTIFDPDTTFIDPANSQNERDIAWRAANNKVFTQAGRIFLSGTLQTVGIPLGPAFDAGKQLIQASNMAERVFRTFAEALMNSEAAKQAMEEIVDETLELFGSVLATVEWIPAYGWVIEAVWDVAMGIRQIIQFVKAQNREPKILFERQTYSPQRDAQKLLNLQTKITSRNGDVTWMFQPPGLGRGQFAPSAFAFHEVEGDWLRMQSTAQESGGMGYLPWNGRMHQAIEISPHMRMADTGRFFAMARSAANLAYAMSFSNGPTMFRVDANKLRAQWGQYLLDLRISISETNTLSRSDKQQLVEWLGNSQDGPQFGWLTDPSIEFDPSLGFVPIQFGIDDPEGVVMGQPHFAQPVSWYRDLHSRQQQALRTLTVAYVDDEYPAFTGVNPGDLPRLLETNRELLLQHQDRCLVDLANVVDPFYRYSLESSLQSFTCQTIPNITARPALPDVPPPVIPGIICLNPPCGAPGSTVPLPPEQRSMLRRVAVPALVLGGASAAAFALDRWLR